MAALGDLSQPLPEALVAVDVVGLSYREAARALGTKERAAPRPGCFPDAEPGRHRFLSLPDRTVPEGPPSEWNTSRRRRGHVSDDV
jgi:hypothetical protein